MGLAGSATWPLTAAACLRVLACLLAVLLSSASLMSSLTMKALNVPFNAGTPINTDVGDLFGQFCVLGLAPFNSKVRGLRLRLHSKHTRQKEGLSFCLSWIGPSAWSDPQLCQPPVDASVPHCIALNTAGKL
jgi:hypothetical protein